MIETKIVIESLYRLPENEKIELMHMAKKFLGKYMEIKNIYISEKTCR